MMLLIFVIMFVNRFIVISIYLLLLNSCILSYGSRVTIVLVALGWGLVHVYRNAFLASCEHPGIKHPSAWYSATRRLLSDCCNSCRSSDLLYLVSSAISHSRYSLVIFCIMLYFKFIYIIVCLSCWCCRYVKCNASEPIVWPGPVSSARDRKPEPVLENVWKSWNRAGKA